MPHPDTVARLIELVADASALDPSEVRPDGKLRGYGLDSVRVVDLIVSIEDVFGVTVNTEDLVTVHTVNDLADYIDRRRSAQGG